MEMIPINITNLSEAILTEILARLPLRILSRFKSVSKTWKSTLESPYFRRLFLSLHKNSSSTSWSIMSLSGSEELVGFHGCKTWALPKSLALFIPQSFNHQSSSNGLVLIKEASGNRCYVGNPVLQQWVKIPPPLVDDSSWSCLVTRVDEDGIVLSFKVVRLSKLEVSNDYVSHTLSLSLYSSDTGIWSFKRIHCPCHITNLSFMTLNGTVYFYYLSMPGVFVAHDFYSESDQFRVIHYPSDDDHSEFKRALTSSGGLVMYVRTYAQKEETCLKIWRLNNDDESWQLLWEIGIPVIGSSYCIPMAMHPFDSGVVYLWSLQNRHLVKWNLRTRRFKVLRDGYAYNEDDDDLQDFVIDQTAIDKHLDEMWGSRSSDWDNGPSSIEVFFQFVLPPWMESVPRPPEVEIIDTTSLLSDITSEED